MTDIFLHMIVPATVNDAVLTASTVPETDYTAWANATAYVVGDTRIKVDTSPTSPIHWVIQCIQAHTSNSGSNNDPAKDIDRTTGGGTYWLRVSYTNKWKAFDQRIGDQQAYVGTITHTLVPTAAASAVALFNLTANSVQVQITNTATAAVRMTTTLSAIETVGIIDWWTYFYNPIDYKSELVFPYQPIYAADTMTITISGLTTNKVGEIAFGIDYNLGKALFPVQAGIIDYSTKDRDTFGNPYITPRAFASRAEYKVYIPTVNSNYIKRALAAVRSVPVVFYTHTTDNNYGTMVYGYIKSFDIEEVAPAASWLTIQVEGLI